MPVQHRDGRPHPAIRLAALALAVLTVVAPLGGVALAQSLGDPAVAERAQEDGTAGRSGSQEAASQTEGAAQDRAPRDEAGAEGSSPEADASPVQDPASSHEASTSPSSEATPQPWYTQRELELLARVVHAEAEGEPFAGRVGVAAVVLNRVRHSRFPDTIAGVIFQPGAFEPVANGRIWEEPDAASWRAAKAALDGWDPTGGALYFYNPAKVSRSSWIWRVHVTGQIGRHAFGWL